MVSLQVLHLFSPRVLPFTVLLGTSEVLLCWYWVELKLGLLYGGILAIPTVFARRIALVTMGKCRTAGH